MKWIDNDTAILRDSSILIFKGTTVELYPSVNWKQPKKIKGHRYGCHQFYYNSRKQAINVWAKIENEL